MRLAAIAALCALPATAFAKVDFTRQEMKVPGAILWTTTGDFDGDGKTDLVTSYRRGNGPRANRYLAVFFQGDSGFGPKPDLAFQAPRAAAVFDVGDALSSPGEELVYMMSDGIYAQSFADRKTGTPVKIIKTPTIVSVPEEEDLVNFDFLRSFGPGEPETMIVLTHGPVKLYRRDGDEWKSWSTVAVAALSYYDTERYGYRASRRGGSSGRPYSFSATTIIPTLTFTEATGDGKIDLVTSFEDRVNIHAQLANGTLSSTPTASRWFELLTEREAAARDMDFGVDIVDFDGDGIADVSATKIGGGLMNMRTETRLYRGKKGGGYDAEPAQVFKDDGFGALISYADVDGDGKVEMIHPYSEVSIIGITRVMLSKELSLDFRFRKRAGDALFEKSPSQTVRAVLGLDFSVGGALRGAYPIFGLDVDGDAVPDAVLSAGSDGMNVFKGQRGKKDLVGDDPDFKISFQATRDTRPFMRTKERRGPIDLLLIYTDHPELTGQILYLRNPR